ncbi:phage holin family protein [Vreelandella sulfidaeris]|uniref:phage holin family protein n=1 Tax=Vreelandella sulfidaeris TaxID=115553 RepID=UPI0035EC9E2F
MDSDNKSTSQTSSVGSLLSNVMHEITSLVRNEIELAKTEMSEKTHEAMGGIASIAIAGAVLLGGFLTLLAAVVFLLNEVLPPDTTPWLGAAIVGIVMTVIGILMLKAGQKKLQARNLMPNRTMNSLHNDKSFAKEHQQNVKEELK